ncbi:PKD domain-containing protein [Robiginitalea sediminis]|uniref:PKD domain-containing protein n=1 Tax=Robiginitalea sediminis TaxID=1982593 RepID=UPI000B4B9B25|nr:PKD domain-containing protein [Robiginitalea sediminis]
MKLKYPSQLPFSLLLLFLFAGLFKPSEARAQINFAQSELNFTVGNVSSGVTSLMYGPDGRLYVAEYPGTIKILTIQRNSATDYEVVAVESLSGVKDIVNHDDDGTPCSGALNDCTSRETTGLTVGGTAQNPVIYVSSSDFRIGAGGGGGNGDVDLDTNSGTITRFTWNGSSWDVVDLVRGLPRSEENHATNGLELTNINGTNYLIVASGGHTNGGAPSTNFVYTTEYALGAAILAVDLDMINSMSIQTDGNGRDYIYDLPTLDDPSRANVNGITDPDDPGYDGVDVNDPFGGNDGLNQAVVVPGGPVQILSPGYRNCYDLVVTQSGALYVTENGANQGWGGFPVGEGTANVTNEYDPAEPGSSSPTPDGEFINNLDHLELITTDLQSYAFNTFYGGHPNPVRANPNGAGLFTAPAPSGTAGAVFRTLTYDPDGSTPGSTTDPNIALPANWPPVPVANPVEGDWRGPGLNNPEGPNDAPVTTWGTNTNGIDEYTASNFGGAMQGNLLAGVNSGVIRRVQLNPDGSLQTLTNAFFSGIGGNALGVTCNSDTDAFPGTVWAGTLNGKIVVFEPQDFVECIAPGEPGYDANADYDSDGYTNQDEVDNGTDPCNGGSQPADFDKVAGAPLISDLNDTDDDADGIPDALDPFQLGDPAVGGSDAFELPLQNDLFNDQQGLGGIFGLGLTGLMNNGDTGANWLDWIDRRDDPNDPNPNDVLGGAPGLMTSHMTSGTALGATNTQEKGYQLGIQTDVNTGSFTAIGNLINLYGPLRIYGNTAAVGGELGHFIGDGTQSNYIKVVLTADGITALQEINDVPGTPVNITLAEADRPLNEMRFFFVVDPSNGEVVIQYAKDGGARQTVTTFTAQGTILNAIQSNAADLAVGFIGTSGTPGVELEGTWDFLNIIGEVPSVVQAIPDITRPINSADENYDLDQYFDDDNGTGNLTYSVSGNTNPNVGASISGNTLTLTYPGTTEVADITIRATDTDTFFVEQTFTVTVTDAPIVLYRVNTGGPALPAIDGGIDWEADLVSQISQYLSEAGNNRVFNSTVMPVDGSVNQATTPLEVYATERYDNIVGPPNMTYTFPVALNGNYEVRLYMGNSFINTSETGERIFDVAIEGKVLPLLNDIDLSGTYGHETGTVITHIVKVDDGNLDISFLHGAIENPLINAIEILDAPDDDTPIYVYQIEDQIGNTGQQLGGSLAVNANGGDGNLSYTATGLPPGLSIEPTNGQIGGTIEASAAAGSPYAVSITVDDSDGLTSDAVTIGFQWTVIDATAYRINAGGATVASADIYLDWEDNSVGGAQTGGNYFVNTGLKSALGGFSYDQRDASIPAYIDQATFDALFAQDRYDGPVAPEMEFTMPIGNGDYVVNLYLGNDFVNTSLPGQRTFDIFLEDGQVADDLDLITTFGHEVGGMLSFPVTVSDDVLNIRFGHVVENPSVRAIEVFVNTFANLSLNAIANQNNDGGDSVNFSVSASGGDPGENYSYYISGQPAGISINPATGQISGTVDLAAGFGGPGNNGVYTTRVSVLKPGSAPATQVFTWNVSQTLLWTDKGEDETYTARHECSFVQAGDKFYLMGGRENAQTLDVYDYSTDSWSSLVNSAPFEFNHYQAVEYQGLIWVIGAFKDNAFPNEVPADHIWMFDPANEEWIQGPEIPQARKRGSAGLVVYNDKFYVVAGNTDGHDGGYVAWFDEYDPATGTWTPLADAPRARDHFHAAVIGDNLYAVGGRLSGGGAGVFKPVIAEVDVFNFTSGTWSTLPAGQNLPTPRGAPVVANFNGKLIVAGGEVQNELVDGVNTDDALVITEEFDPATGTWSRLADLNFKRHGTQGIVSGNGLFVTGGSPNRGGGNQKNMEVLGLDAPVGTPSVASSLSVPASVVIADGATESIEVDITGGNQGVFIRSMSLVGANAADFSIVSGELTNALLPAGATHSVSVTLSGTGADRVANLVIDYGAVDSESITLTNSAALTVDVTNPGDQYNYEGDPVTLPVVASGPNSLTYAASGLPPDLSINPNTGVITGSISDGSGGGNAFNEQNGIVVIEAESGTLVPNWSTTTADGELGIIAGTNSFANQNGGTIPYQINISTPGVYRFIWNSFYSGPIATEENDAWLRFPNDANVWFFATDASAGNPGTEAEMIANIQGAQNEVVFPIGSGREGPTTTPNGAGANGYFKVYKSGGTSEVYEWEAFTSDNDGHNIYVYFANPGTYTMEISERSLGHAIDKIVLLKKDTQSGIVNNASALDALEESPTGGVGASIGSPYNVQVTVTDDVTSEQVTADFQWFIGQIGDLIAVPEANPISGEAPLTVQFTGSNSLDDVGVVSYAWDFKDGGTSTEADPQYTFNTPGTYDVDLTVTDGDSNTDTKSITIEVTTGPSQPPVADAGADQEITLPNNSGVLSGSATDPDGGTITAYLWTQQSGPSTATLSGENTAVLTASDLVEGTYVFRLTATDDEAETGFDEVTVTVLPEPLPPVVDAGADQEITLPTNSVVLTGTASDPDGGAIVTLAWTQESGPAAATLSGADTATLTASDLVEGVYVFRLTATDDESDTGFDEITVTVLPEPLPPVVDAGADQDITLPISSVVLTGTASDPDGGAIAAFVWTQESGPATATLSGADTATLTASDLVEGTYVFRLTVTDDEGDTAFDEVQVTVNAAVTQPPVADAGADQEIALPTNTVVLTGTASDPDGGTIVTYAWTQVSGPDAATLSGADTATLTAGDLLEGTYVFRLTVTDDEGETGFDEVTVTVLPESLPPVVDAGADQEIVLPADTAVLTGTATDPDGGNIVTYAWTQQSGPANATFTGADTETLTASGLQEGVYVFRLTATDDEGQTGFDEVTVTVIQTQPPVVEAGPNQTIALPVNSVFLNGTASDPDGGAIVTLAWTQESGPAAATLGGADTATLTASDLVEGTYVFRLTATDDEGETAFDEVTVTVNPETANAAPDAVAEGTPISGTAPLTVQFTGRNSTDDFGIVSYLWEFGDGSTSDATDPEHTFTEAGTYTVVLTVTDGEGLTDTASLTITVTEAESISLVAINPVRNGVAEIQVLGRPSDRVITDILIHDYTGKLVGQFDPEDASVRLGNDAFQLSVYNVGLGLYFVTFEFDNGDPEIVKILITNP